MTRVNIRMDENLKNKAEGILNELGLNMNSVVNIFIKQLVRNEELPFTPTLAVNKSSSDDMQIKFESLINFANNNKRIEKDFKFNRDDYYYMKERHL